MFYDIVVIIKCYRYGYSIVASLLMFGCFWVLLEKVNKDMDLTSLSPHDKTIFWVRARTGAGA